MEKWRRFFGRKGFDYLGVGLFSMGALVVFWQALPKFVALVSPDSGPFFVYAHKTSLISEWLSGITYSPHVLYFLLFPPLGAHDLSYVLDSLVLCLAGAYYLKGLRLHPLAAWFGGLALGFSGYTFTLFSAGHRGYFHMFSCAVWSFGLLVRCFGARTLFHFAALGLVLAWGLVCQPDVLVLVGLLAAAYALWLTFKADHQAGSWRGAVGRRILSVWPRFLLSVAVFLLAGFGGLRAALTTSMQSRDAQIASVTGEGRKPAASSAERSEADKHSRWIFATNWSLPPEDALEFVVPGIFGNESMQSPYPYWGRLGRPAEETFQKGRMMPNYRQHTVYLGVVSVLFAFLGVWVWASQRKARDASPVNASACAYSDVPFWCGVWVICLALAMGRFLPVYRLFYMIPYMDYIRAPVKLFHLVEVASAFLAGFGMDAFLRDEQGRVRRRAMWAGAGFFAAFLVGVLVMLVARPGVVRHISELGLGPVSGALGGYAVQNFVRSACLSAVVAGLAFFSIRAKAAVRWGVVCLVVLVLDQAFVARRYVRVVDVEPFYHANAVVKAIKKGADGGGLPAVVNYVTPNALAQEWFSTALSLNGIRNLAPAPEDQGTPYGRLFAGLQQNPVRLWQLLHAQYAVVPRKSAEGLMRAGVLRPVLDFEMGAGVVRSVSQPGESTLALAQVAGIGPNPRFVTQWEGGMPAEKQVEAAIQGKMDVSDAPAPASQSQKAGDSRTEILSQQGRPGAFQTRIKVSAAQAGLLIFDERLSGKQAVLIDGKPAVLHVADAVWPAALVPAGEHVVVLKKQRDGILSFLSGATSLAVLVWGAFLLYKSRRVDGAESRV